MGWGESPPRNQSTNTLVTAREQLLHNGYGACTRARYTESMERSEIWS